MDYFADASGEDLERIKGDFLLFEKMLSEKNEQMNLTSITDGKEIKIKHFEDSLSAERFLFYGAAVAEVGSGGGFPSVPLKIMRRDLRFTLIESVGKKCGFLNSVKEALGFENFDILNARCEEAAKKPEYRENFDFAVARAVAKLNTLAEYTLPFVKVGGKVIAYKGECEEEIKNAKSAITVLGGEISEIYRYELSENRGARTLVIINKIGATPSKYPRGRGKERSKPL